MTDRDMERQWRARDLGAADGRVYLGEASVDGGELLVVDPAYLPERCDQLVDEIHDDMSWYGFGREVLRNRRGPDERLAVLLRLESDGGYPIWAEHSADGRVIRYTIEVERPEQIANEDDA